MFRIFAALTLLCLNTVVAATSVGGLRYCLCEGMLFTGAMDPCHVQVETVVPETCSACCDRNAPVEAPVSELPCQEHCVIELVFDTEDHLAAPGAQRYLLETTTWDVLPVTHLSFSDAASDGELAEVVGETPPGLLRATVPLRLRHAVWQI